eukprot:TRINITY_DN15007_c0_g2_i2.p1 TRINITY_DN15007_c0_g2~~TRINITY_DN15007_c0_g2_i2.p1  ORF type:complete len:294 (+),score=67.86 TRINITY_DN15007_c0_g2_i2:138-1019(+)
MCIRDSFKGGLTSADNSFYEVGGHKLQVGAWSGVPGIYSSSNGPSDLILGAAPNHKVFFGSGTGDAYITAGTGSLWTKGSVEAHDNIFVYAEENRLRVGSIWGLPGLYSSDGTPRDMIIGTEKNKKIYFGWHREDAWIEAGSGNSFFKGAMTINNKVTVSASGQTVTLGDVHGMAGVTSSDDGVARDLMVAAGTGKKVYFGNKKEDASIEVGAGNMWLKGALDADVKARAFTATSPATFEDTVTVKKNLILLSAANEERNMLEEMDELREQNAMLMKSMSEMRETMETLMQQR